MRLHHHHHLVIVIIIALIAAAATSVQAQPLPVTQGVLRYGFTGPLGTYYVAGLGFRLRAGTLLVGATSTATLGVEPLLSFTKTVVLPEGWSLVMHASRGDLGGDYLVDRLPELTLRREVPLAATPLRLGLEAGAGYFVVRPAGVDSARWTLAPSLRASVPLGPGVSLAASAGYRQYLYGTGDLHGAWWASASLNLTPAPGLTANFSYGRQAVTGASPLFFDAMSADHSVAGSVSLRVARGATVTHSQSYNFLSQERVYALSLSLPQGLSLSHSQTYSFLSASVTARVYTLTVSPPGLSFSLSYDDVPQRWSGSLTFSR